MQGESHRVGLESKVCGWGLAKADFAALWQPSSESLPQGLGKDCGTGDWEEVGNQWKLSRDIFHSFTCSSGDELWGLGGLLGKERAGESASASLPLLSMPKLGVPWPGQKAGKTMGSPSSCPGKWDILNSIPQSPKLGPVPHNLNYKASQPRVC